MSRRVRIVVSIVALLATSAAGMLAYVAPLLAHDARIECCCGEHAVDEACGCPDCPSAVYESERQNIADGDVAVLRRDRISPCGPDEPHSIGTCHVVWALPPKALPPPSAWRALVTRTHGDIQPGEPFSPEVPPG